MTVWTKYFKRDATTFGQLATDDTAMYVRTLFARHEHLLALSPAILDALAIAFVERRYQDAEFLAHPGGREPCVFLILQGEVMVEDDSGIRSRRRTGQLISYLECMSGHSAEKRCQAVGPLRVAKLSGAVVRMLHGTNLEIWQALARSCRHQQAIQSPRRSAV